MTAGGLSKAADGRPAVHASEGAPGGDARHVLALAASTSRQSHSTLPAMYARGSRGGRRDTGARVQRQVLGATICVMQG